MLMKNLIDNELNTLNYKYIHKVFTEQIFSLQILKILNLMNTLQINIDSI